MKEDYPLFIKWRYILDHILDISGKFPKNVRFNLCDRLTNLSLDVLELIIEAIYTQKRIPLLNQANLNVEKVRALIYICFSRRYISEKQYRYIAEEINEAGRMIGGWLKTCAE